MYTPVHTYFARGGPPPPPLTRPKIHSTHDKIYVPVILAPPPPPKKARFCFFTYKKGKMYSSASPGRRHRRRLLPVRPRQEPPDDDVPGRPLLRARAWDKEGEGGAAEVALPVQGRAEGGAGEAGEKEKAHGFHIFIIYIYIRQIFLALLLATDAGYLIRCCCQKFQRTIRSLRIPFLTLFIPPPSGPDDQALPQALRGDVQGQPPHRRPDRQGGRQLQAGKEQENG